MYLNKDLGRIEGKVCHLRYTVEGCCRSIANALDTCAVKGQANTISNKTIHCPSSWIICTRPDQWRIVLWATKKTSPDGKHARKL